MASIVWRFGTELFSFLERILGTFTVVAQVGWYAYSFETCSCFVVANVVGFSNRLRFLKFTKRAQALLITQPKLARKKSITNLKRGKKQQQKHECILQQAI